MSWLTDFPLLLEYQTTSATARTAATTTPPTMVIAMRMSVAISVEIAFLRDVLPNFTKLFDPPSYLFRVKSEF